MMLRGSRILVIGNPASKNGAGAKASSHAQGLLAQALGADAVDEVLTASTGHATSLAAQAAGRYDVVIAVGGDGVIHETANGLMSVSSADRPALGIVPVGSGNDYARTLGMSEDVDTAVAQLLAGRSRLMDVGQVNGEYFVETLSFGLDAAIALGTVERRKHTTKTGGALYFEVGIDQLLHHLDTFRFQAKFDDRAVDGESILFAIQIGPTYGGGFKVCPEADPTDGIFDICYAQAPISLPRAILTFARAKNGKHVGTRGMCFDAAQTISLHFETEPPAQADGEKVTGTDFDICMHPSALRVFVA